MCCPERCCLLSRHTHTHTHMDTHLQSGALSFSSPAFDPYDMCPQNQGNYAEVMCDMSDAGSVSGLARFLWRDRDCFGRQAKAQSVLALARDGQVFRPGVAGNRTETQGRRGPPISLVWVLVELPDEHVRSVRILRIRRGRHPGSADQRAERERERERAERLISRPSFMSTQVIPVLHQDELPPPPQPSELHPPNTP